MLETVRLRTHVSSISDGTRTISAPRSEVTFTMPIIRRLRPRAYTFDLGRFKVATLLDPAEVPERTRLDFCRRITRNLLREAPPQTKSMRRALLACLNEIGIGRPRTSRAYRWPDARQCNLIRISALCVRPGRVLDVRRRHTRSQTRKPRPVRRYMRKTGGLG
jgi:hypothetical protein